ERADRIQVELDHVRGAALGPGIGVHHTETRAEILSGLPGKLQAIELVVDAAELLRTTLHVTVLLHQRHLAAHGHGIRDRHVDHAGDVPAVELAAGHTQITLQLITRLPGNDPDRASCAVATEQRALRAAQYLDALDIEHAHHGAGGAGHEHVVHVEAHAALTRGAGTGTDAADLEAGRRVAVAARALDVEVGRNGGEFEHVAHAALLEFFTAEGHQ